VISCNTNFTQNIQKLLRQKDIAKGIGLVEKALDKYARYAAVIQDEILEVAMISKENNIKFYFDPKKFKYNLSSSFIEKYYISIALLEFNLEHSDEIKFKILEKVFYEYPANCRVATTFLDFILERWHDDHMDKKIIDIIERVFALNPSRVFANYLLKVNRKDLFEVAQRIVQTVAETNIERAWFMLIISTKLHLLAKAKEIIIQHLGDNIHASDLAKFYVENYTELSKDAEILESVKKICDEEVQ
jgi:predicted regulator of amino acid metabolism with ACT domain